MAPAVPGSGIINDPFIDLHRSGMPAQFQYQFVRHRIIIDALRHNAYAFHVLAIWTVYGTMHFTCIPFQFTIQTGSFTKIIYTTPYEWRAFITLPRFPVIGILAK